jgi:hypothetical protein
MVGRDVLTAFRLELEKQAAEVETDWAGRASRSLRAAGGAQPKKPKDFSKLQDRTHAMQAGSSLPPSPLKQFQGRKSQGQAAAGLVAPMQPKMAEMTEEQRRRMAHAYYVQHREQILAKKRAYRVRNKAQIARRQKAYRRKLKYGKKKRTRIDTGGHSYMYGGFS